MTESIENAEIHINYIHHEGLKIPEASGTEVVKTTRSGESVIDYSNSSQGYVMLKNNGAEHGLIAYITDPDGVNYQYSFEPDGNFIVCPLQSGNGNYVVQIMENMSGSSYQSINKIVIDVILEDSSLPFLYPNRKVNFSESSMCVAKAAELTMGLHTDSQKIEAICNFVAENIKYDNEKAKTVQPGYIPDPDRTLKEGKGICSDYASLLAAMLRSQNIVTKMVEGDLDSSTRHAWNMIYMQDTLVYMQEKGTIAVKVAPDGIWKVVDSTYASGAVTTLDEYIGNIGIYSEDKYY